MSQKRKFSQYKNLYQALSREGISQPGPTSMILFEAFLEQGGEIKASILYGRGVCEKGSKFQFVDWRDALVKKEFLKYEVKEYSNRKEVIYRPGKNLNRYLNREKFESAELATKTDVEHAVDQALARIVNIIDPPADEEKIDRLGSGGYDSELKLLAKKHRTADCEEKESSPYHHTLQ